MHFRGLYLLLFLMFFTCESSSEWISFHEYFCVHDKSVDAANVIRTKANCDSKTVQIIPGDCRPVYTQVSNALHKFSKNEGLTENIF